MVCYVSGLHCIGVKYLELGGVAAERVLPFPCLLQQLCALRLLRLLRVFQCPHLLPQLFQLSAMSMRPVSPFTNAQTQILLVLGISLIFIIDHWFGQTNQ